MREVNAGEQQYNVFEYCVLHKDNKDAWLGFRRLNDGWSLIQYDAHNIEGVASNTPVWAVWRPEGNNHDDCLVIYGDPHIVVSEHGHRKTQKLEGADFKTVAEFTLDNGDVLYFVGAAAADGNLSEVYVNSRPNGTEFVWGKSEKPDKPAEITGQFGRDGFRLFDNEQ